MCTHTEDFISQQVSVVLIIYLESLIICLEYDIDICEKNVDSPNSLIMIDRESHMEAVSFRVGALNNREQKNNSTTEDR